MPGNDFRRGITGNASAENALVGGRAAVLPGNPDGTSMGKLPVGIIGISWFRPEDYDRLRNSVFVDGDDLHETYAEWLTSAETAVVQFITAGHAVERVYIDADEFSEWCVAEGIAADSTARSRYASAVVGRKYLDEK